MNSRMQSVKVIVPATSANLGPGFDAIGLALTLYNHFTLSVLPAGLEFTFFGKGRDILFANERNYVYQAALRVFDKIGEHPPGLHISIFNNIPIASGLGSSSTAIVGGMVGANALMGNPLSRHDLLELATEMEGHPDNVMPAICGGLTLGIMDKRGLFAEEIAVPNDMRVVIVRPDFAMPTKEARAVLPTSLSQSDVVFNLSRTPLLLRALEQGNYAKLGVAMQDRIHEPYRLPLIVGAEAALAAAEANGAAGVALSGAGPSLIAFAHDNHEAIAMAMHAELANYHPSVDAWVLDVDRTGAQVEALVKSTATLG
ncbi:MAG: homoserine kinase [Candidatus Promineifilaceae bacterium]